MSYENDIIETTSCQLEKENYIANILIRTLYANSIDETECYRIIELFKKKVIGDKQI